MTPVHSTPLADYSNGGTKLVVLILSILVTVRAEAEPLAEYLAPSVTAQLADAGSVNESSSGKDAALVLAPYHHEAKAIRSALVAEDPDIVVEALFLWKKASPALPAAEMLAAFNVLRSISTLQGIEYYSASRKKIRPLYTYSSLITGPSDDTPVRDTRLGSMPSYPETLFARQNDTTFGDNRYRIVLSGGLDFVSQHSTNLTKLSLGIVPVAGPGDVHVRLLILRVDEGLLFYIASSARAALVPGVRATLETSFANRATAVYNWFSSELTTTWP